MLREEKDKREEVHTHLIGLQELKVREKEEVTDLPQELDELVEVIAQDAMHHGLQEILVTVLEDMM